MSKTATELEEEKKEIEDLALQAADEIDSDDDDDSSEKDPFTAEDIGKPPAKNPAGRKPKDGALTKTTKGMYFDPGSWLDAEFWKQCAERFKVHCFDCLATIEHTA